MRGFRRVGHRADHRIDHHAARHANNPMAMGFIAGKNSPWRMCWRLFIGGCATAYPPYNAYRSLIVGRISASASAAKPRKNPGSPDPRASGIQIFPAPAMRGPRCAFSRYIGCRALRRIGSLPDESGAARTARQSPIP